MHSASQVMIVRFDIYDCVHVVVYINIYECAHYLIKPIDNYYLYYCSNITTTSRRPHNLLAFFANKLIFYLMLWIRNIALNRY